MTGMVGGGVLQGVTQGSVRAVSAVAGALIGDTSTSPPRYGMTMRFEVTVKGGTARIDLGSWSGCSGLDVKLNPVKHKSGGRYDALEYLPGEVTYGEVTLERAMDSKSSKKVQQWLGQVVEKWVNSDDAASGGFTGSNVKISLRSSFEGAPVAEWELENAIPISWTGPTLSARGNDIAIEKLTLAHDGFVKPSGRTAGGSRWQSSRVQTLSITDKTDPGKRVSFAYHPEKVTMDRTVNFKDTGQTLRTMEQQVTNPGKLKITMNDLLLEGRSNVKRTMETLWGWLAGDESQVTGGKANADPTVTAKTLQLRIGSGGRGLINYHVALKQVTANYTRFTQTGVPNRASVNLTFEKIEPAKDGTNPSSVTLEPGRVHRLVAGDSLQSIAQANYGNAAAWRQVADANGIDDPMRLRNGTSLLLPDVG